jgi:glycosyltransferase involved in cell wall biosynthesis
MNRYVPEYKILKFSNKAAETLLVIPVINEGDRILGQLRNIHQKEYLVDIAIADGGSTDGSIDDKQLLKSLGVNFLLTKLGPGRLSSQLLMAFDYALVNDYKYVITMDGNGKDGPEGIIAIETALKAGFDFVQGSRYVTGGIAIRTPRLRAIAIKFIHAPLTSIAARRKFTDTTNGFRGFSNRFLTGVDVDIFRPKFNSYELIFYLPIRASRCGYKNCEVPVSRVYPDGPFIPTKIHGLRSYIRLFKILLMAVSGKYNPRD